MKDRIQKFACSTSEAVGTSYAFLIALGIIVVWAVLGPVFGFSDTWQLLINTGTTITTFLMLFLLQHSQNRDGRVVQLKLDELIRAVETARNQMVKLEEAPDAELQRVSSEMKIVAAQPEGTERS